MAATDYDWNRTRNSICEKALRLVGAYGPGDPVSGTDMVVAADTLNDMVKEWQSRDIFLWQFSTTLALSALNDPVLPISLGDPIIAIDSARWLNDTSEDKLEIISYSEYDDLSDKTREGPPEKISLASNDGFGTVYVYPIPPADTQILLRVVLPMRDWDTASGTGEMPTNWLLALEYSLAELLADEYKLPMNERVYLQDKANGYFKRAKISDKNRSDRNVVRGAF